MSASIRRHAVVVGLILVAGVAAAAIGSSQAASPALPAIATLTGGTTWSMETAYAPGDAGGPYQQWLVRDPAGSEALLYVGATARVQTVARWTGELGYQGEGYLVTDRSEANLRLDDGSAAIVSRVRLRHLADDRLIEYAVVRPDGVVPSGTSSLPAMAWSALSGGAGPYYLVRASVPAGDAAAADRLMAAVLPPLLSRSRAG